MSPIYSQSEQVGDRYAQLDWFQFGPAKSPFDERSFSGSGRKEK